MCRPPEPYYQDELVTLYLGDCRAPSFAPLWTSAELVLTDPPYGIGWRRGANAKRSDKGHPGIAGDHDTSTRDEALALVVDTPRIVFGSFYAPAPDGLVHVLVRHAGDDAGVIGATTGYRRDLEPVYLCGPWPRRPVEWPSLLTSRTYRSAKAVAADAGHPHAKPVDVLVALLGRTGAASVADPFAGSGSTLLAARQVGVVAVGIEVDEQHAETAARRLSQGMLGLV